MSLKSEKPVEIQLLAWLGLECNGQEFQNFDLKLKNDLNFSDFDAF